MTVAAFTCSSDRPVSLVGEVVLPTSNFFCILALWAFKQPASIWVARKSNGNNPVPIQYMTGKSFRSSTRCLLSSATFQHHVMSTSATRLPNLPDLRKRSLQFFPLRKNLFQYFWPDLTFKSCCNYMRRNPTAGEANFSWFDTVVTNGILLTCFI